jgi:hypothetical protein
MPPKKSKDAAILTALYEEVGERVSLHNEGAGITASQRAEATLQVQYLNIQLVRPDPIQPRRILPERIHQEFHQQRFSPAQALKELITLAQVHARSEGRPFSNPFELLGDLAAEETEATGGETPPTLSSEEQLLRDLIQLAATLQNDGQVNPLTVVNVSQGVSTQYMIETGERRFWATWLLRDFHPAYTHDGKIPCIVVPAEKSSPFRQAKENTSRAGLNAIAMARQIALLLLHVHGFEIPTGSTGMDFYRQALNLDLRGKREYTEAVYTALGGISKRKLSGYKGLLKLCDEAIELADRNNIEESILSHVTSLDKTEDQIELLHQIIDMGLTRKQVREIIEKGYAGVTNSDEEDNHIFRVPKAAMQIAKLALKPDSLVDAHRLAEAFVGLERDRGVAKARMKALREMLEEAEMYIDGV